MAANCWNCGSALSETARFCGKCGASVADAPLVRPDEPVRRTWLVPVVAVAAVFAVLLAGYGLTRSNHDAALTPVPVETGAAATSTAAAAQFDVVAHCKANPNDPGPGEQDTSQLPPQVVAAGADFWRCAGGQVLVCEGGASGRACQQQAPVDQAYLAELQRFCSATPDAMVPNAIAGAGRDWRCQGTTPVPDGTSQIDANGFLAQAWRPLGSSGPAMGVVQAAYDALDLTEVESPQTGMSCWIAFDKDGKKVVGAWDYEEGQDWHFGINGKPIVFSEKTVGKTSTFTSKEGYRITDRTVRQVRGEDFYKFAAALDAIELTLEFGESVKRFDLYRFCGSD